MKNNRLTRTAIIFLGIYILVQIIARIFFYQEYMLFHAEQARDFTLVQHAYENHQWITLGPVQANTDNLHLGPIYYYILLVFLIPFQFHPIGGAVMVTLFWLATSVLAFVYLYKRSTPTIAYFFAFLIAANETLFIYTSYALNTSILLFFVALFIISTIEWIKQNDFLYSYFSCFALAILLHLHLSSFALLPMLFVVGILYYKRLNWHVFFALCIIPLSFVPMLMYDMHHHFEQVHAYLQFAVGDRQQNVTSLGQAVNSNTVINALEIWFGSSVISQHRFSVYTALWFKWTAVVSMLVIVSSVVGYTVIKMKKYFVSAKTFTQKKKHAQEWIQRYPERVIIILFTLSIWSATIAIHTSLIRHYLLIIWIPLLVMTILLSALWNTYKSSKIISVVICMAYLGLHMYNFAFDVRLAPTIELDKPHEGVSVLFAEQNQLAQQIAGHLPATDPTLFLPVGGTSKDVQLVMHYLIDYHAGFDMKFIGKGKWYTADQIVYITTKEKTIELNPNIQTQHFYVYFLTKKQWKQVKKH